MGGAALGTEHPSSVMSMGCGHVVTVAPRCTLPDGRPRTSSPPRAVCSWNRLLQMQEGSALERSTPLQGSVSQLWCQEAGHTAVRRGILF